MGIQLAQESGTSRKYVQPRAHPHEAALQDHPCICKCTAAASHRLHWHSGKPMTQEDAQRIQSSQEKAGHDTGKGSFAATAQSAGDKNANGGKK